MGTRTGTQHRQQPFPWLGLLPSLLVLGGMVIWGIAVYPYLPQQVPQHFGPDGIDAYADRSVGSVFLPVFVYAGVVVLMAGSAELVRRIRPESELRPGERTSPLVNRPRTREGAAAVLKATLLLSFCLGLTFAVTCLAMWQTGPPSDPSGWLLAGALAPTAAGTVAVLVASFRDKRAARSAERAGPSGKDAAPSGRRPVRS